jgi:selenocysteine lyase/cysteine desulfurase
MQAVGTEPLDLAAQPVDILAAGARKWLLGPPGVAWLYVRRELLDRIAPTLLGTRSMKPSPSYIIRDVALREDAGRFESGVQNLAGIAAAGASLRLLSEVGLPRVRERIAALTEHLVEALKRKRHEILSPRERPGERSAIVTFRHPGLEARAVHKQLSDAGVVISIREGALRASLHFYNTLDEVERLISALPR